MKNIWETLNPVYSGRASTAMFSHKKGDDYVKGYFAWTWQVQQLWKSSIWPCQMTFKIVHHMLQFWFVYHFFSITQPSRVHVSRNAYQYVLLSEKLFHCWLLDDDNLSSYVLALDSQHHEANCSVLWIASGVSVEIKGVIKSSQCSAKLEFGQV